MATATAPGTCHRCKGSILPGDSIARYNRPAIGTLYHAACPASGPPAAPVTHAGQLTPESIAAIVAELSAKLTPAPIAGGAPAPLATAVPEPEPEADAPVVDGDVEPETVPCACCGTVECPDCTYEQYAVTKGYEPLGFDCPGQWMAPAPPPEPTAEPLAARLERLRTSLAAEWAQRSTARAELVAAALDGAAPDDARRISRYAEGLYDGVDLAVLRAERLAEAARLDAQRTNVADWRLASGTLSLALLVDDDAATVAMRQEARARDEQAAHAAFCKQYGIPPWSPTTQYQLEKLGKFLARLQADADAEAAKQLAADEAAHAAQEPTP